MKYSNKGFTLIELLVVISIVSLLSSVILTSLSSARNKARDAQRLRSVQSIRTALELYRDKYGGYPDSTGCNATATDGTTYWCKSSHVISDHWIRDSLSVSRGSPGTLAEFLSADPLEPKQGTSLVATPGTNLLYFSLNTSYGVSNNNWYMIRFLLESPKADLEAIDGTYTPNGTCFDYGQTGSGTVSSCTTGVQTNTGDITWGPLGGI